MLFPYLMIATGGALGSLLRYTISRTFAPIVGALAFPWATWTINILGSFLIGIAAAYLVDRPTPARREWYLFFGTGFCGGFTTFSTFSLEVLYLLRAEKHIIAFVYVSTSFLMGLVAVAIGYRWFMDR